MFQLIVIVAGVGICIVGLGMMVKGEVQFSRKTRLRGFAAFAASASIVCIGLAFGTAGMLVVPLLFPGSPPAANAPTVPPAKVDLKSALGIPHVADKSYTRKEFLPLVLGKSEAEVREKLGPPGKTSTSVEGATAWHYKGVVAEVETTGEGGVVLLADQDTQLVFADGKVDDVVFNWPKVP